MLKLLLKLFGYEPIRESEPKEYKVIKTYVPVSDGYPKPYKERWQDKSYLETVARLSQNNCRTSELLNTLSVIRNYADTAQTPEELSGVNRCIDEVKRLLSISQRAIDAIEYMKQAKEMEGANDTSSR